VIGRCCGFARAEAELDVREGGVGPRQAGEDRARWKIGTGMIRASRRSPRPAPCTLDQITGDGLP
jgi:hypothetical protein